MKKLLFTFLMTGFCLAMYGQTVLEDFETGAALNWVATDGTFDGVFENPDKMGINASDSVGSYTKSNTSAFSLFEAQLASPLDLSTNNQFSIQINAPVGTQILMKLQGTTNAVEATRNIANINVWQEYTFDFSGASAFSDLDRIILFFDPGEASSGDTYLFDNLVVSPAGPCAGTVPDPDIIDDFECQRNASYGAGWDVLKAIANPDPTGINTSASVGEYTDPFGPGTEFSPLVIDYHNPIDLSTKNTFKAKVWAPKTGDILFKLEGGVSPAAEKFIAVTETNKWVEYSADFSDQAAANHKKLVLFFNAGVPGDSLDVYYVDDIEREETPQGVVWEDFQNTAKLFWQPANNDQVIHGTFNGVVANPTPVGVNSSTFVGSYNKGSSNLSTLVAFLPSSIDLTQFPQFNLDVLTPGPMEVTLQLSSATQGIKERTATIPPASSGWVTLSFDFDEFNAITDFNQVNVLFDPNQASTGLTYYFDNLTQSGSTVDPCEGVDPIPFSLDDFECQRNITYSAGNDRLEVINNPDVSPANPSSKVGEYTDVVDQWSALVLDFGSPIDLSVFNQFRINIWSPLAVPLKFKLEGGTSPPVEVDTTVSNTSSWETYVIDLSPFAGEDHQKLAIFFNAGVTPSQEDVYYIDDLKFTRASYNGCIDDHESVVSTLPNFSYFANGTLEANGYPFKVVANPDPDAVNPSSMVGEFVKAGDALPFAGMFHDLDVPIDFDGNPTIKAKVLMDHIGNFAIKLEASATGAAAIEIPVANTVENDWEELTFDFSSAPVDAEFMRLTVFFDLGIDATGSDVTSYFDDIIIGNGTCATVGIRDLQVRKLEVYPNPASESVVLDQANDLVRIDLFNALGQKVLSRELNREEKVSLDIAHLEAGIYVLTGYSKDGLVANTKIVKQ
jgi:hypothetical protein